MQKLYLSLSYLASFPAVATSLALGISGTAIVGETAALRRSAPSSKLAVEYLEPRYFKQLGAQRAKLRYGPYTVPPSTENMGMKVFDIDPLEVPCRDCYITSLTAGLQFPDGTVANTNTSMWLHHAVLANLARTDLTCTGREDAFERILASGNERPLVDFTLGGTRKLGYYIAVNDTMVMVSELMNEARQPRDAVITIDWEFLPGSLARTASVQAVRPIWLDIDGACGAYQAEASEVPVPAGGERIPFRLTMSPAWTSTVAGEVVLGVPHLHDGGVVLETTRNGRVACRAEARYGEDPGFVSPDGGEMPGMDMRTSHISSVDQCRGLGRTEVGDTWSVTASYDMAAHEGMVGEDGKPSPIMGLSVVYVVP